MFASFLRRRSKSIFTNHLFLNSLIVMFNKGAIWAYPTDTSFGLGVRADDADCLEKLMELKQRSGDKYFSLMVRDWEMLKKFAMIDEARMGAKFFTETPRTAILEPTKALPISKFWPAKKVAFRICTLPEVASHIEYPVTATSANISGYNPIYTVDDIKEVFGEKVQVNKRVHQLQGVPPSEIWDFTGKLPTKIR